MPLHPKPKAWERATVRTTISPMTQSPAPPRKALSDIMDPSWARALEPVEPVIRRMGDFLRQEHAQGHATAHSSCLSVMSKSLSWDRTPTPPQDILSA